MAVVNKFNVNREQVTLDADIIENMSANDVSYNDSTQYDENTVGDKLSELESKTTFESFRKTSLENKRYYINYVDGTPIPIPSYSYSDPINLQQGDRIVAKISCGASAAAIAVYNKDEEYLISKSKIGLGEERQIDYEYTATESCLVKICAFEGTPILYIVYGNITPVIESIRADLIEKESEIQKNANEMNRHAFTQDSKVNACLAHLFIDLTDAPSYDKSKFYVVKVVKNYLGYWGISIGYEDTLFTELFSKLPDQEIIEITTKNVFLYARFYWDAINDGLTLSGKSLNPCAFDSKNDPRVFNNIINETTKIPLMQTQINSINDKITVKGNKYEKSSFSEPGYIQVSDGTVNMEYESYKHSLPIQLKTGDKVEGYVQSGASACVLAVYSTEGEYLSKYSIVGEGESVDQNFIFTAPEDVTVIFGSCIGGNRQPYYYIYTSIIPIFDDILSQGIKSIWPNKKWSVVGDSITENNNRASKHYYEFIKESTGLNFINLGIGGTGYVRGRLNGVNFINRVSQVQSDSDVITIFGSFNDLDSSYGGGLPIGSIDDTSEDTACGLINKTIEAFKTAFPLIPLGIITPAPWSNFRPTSTKQTLCEQYVQAIIDICAVKSIPCLDLFHNSNLRPWDYNFRILAYSKDGTYTKVNEGESDAILVTEDNIELISERCSSSIIIGDYVTAELSGVHPDENGQKLMATSILGFLKTLII